jgi:hypothetical protein
MAWRIENRIMLMSSSSGMACSERRIAYVSMSYLYF